METLEVHSKDFLVKWVHASDNCSIVWQVKPLKKSINFGIYRKNDQLNLLDRNGLDETSENHVEIPTGNSSTDAIGSTFASPDQVSPNKLSRLRSRSVASVNQITELNVYKTKSRSATFSSNLNNSDLILVKNYYKLNPGELVRGTFDVRRGGMIAFIFDNSFSKTISKKVLFSSKIVGKIEASPSNSTNSVPLSFTSSAKPPTFNETPEDNSNNIMRPKNGELMQSVLLKKRRKKLQGYVKRFFILNFKYGTLSYFKNNDNKLRGQMPIIHSIISANSKTREIFIDSGMEVWDLKTLNDKDFDAWVNAFNLVKRNQTRDNEPDAVKENFDGFDGSYKTGLEEVYDGLNLLLIGFHSLTNRQLEDRLRSITENAKFSLDSLKSNHEITSIASNTEFYDAHENFDGFGVVLVENSTADKRSDEEYDGEDGELDSSSTESDGESEELPAPTASVYDYKADTKESGSGGADSTLFPLPLDPVKRHCDIPVCDHYPPSLISFVRKNVGKDLSSLSMPVDMNEPITILQRYAEILEYCDMIDNAIQGKYPDDSGEKILRIAAFAASYLSSIRIKVRSSRKPFNPLLGETFELVREDKGFRLISEKVSHRPPVFALFAESADWTLSFSPAPSQKFWGKTSEIYTKGILKLTIRSTGEVFTWSQPTCVLKNIIAGEKYTEPAASVTVKSSSGQKAVVEFSKGGMFSGRSEEFSIKAYDGSKKVLPYTVTGNWTESMTLKTNSTEKTIWTAGELLPNSGKKFGFTSFAGSLNKITSIEEDKLPPTDSRLRPDMQSYEKGDIAAAERLKQELEVHQRRRRKELEDSNESYSPLFFEQVGGDSSQPDSGEWVYKCGDYSYWNRRKRQDWSGVQPLW